VRPFLDVSNWFCKPPLEPTGNRIRFERFVRTFDDPRKELAWPAIHIWRWRDWLEDCRQTLAN